MNAASTQIRTAEAGDLRLDVPPPIRGVRGVARARKAEQKVRKAPTFQSSI